MTPPLTRPDALHASGAACRRRPADRSARRRRPTRAARPAGGRAVRTGARAATPRSADRRRRSRSKLQSGRQPDAVVAHPHPQRAASAGGGDLDAPAGQPRPDAVTNRVLDERLEEKAGTITEQVVVRVARTRDAPFEPRGLDGEVVVEERQLLAERDERLRGVRSDARSRSPSCAISRRAICGLVSVKALMVLSALNRKCGWSCARRLCRLASTSRRSRSAVRSASSCASRDAALRPAPRMSREIDTPAITA